MQNKSFNSKALMSGLLTIIAAFVILYGGTFLISFGALPIASLYVALELIKLVLIGFAIVIIFNIFGLKLGETFEIIFSITVNIVLYYFLFQNNVTEGVEKVGSSVIIRHKVVENSSYDLGTLIFIIISTSILLGIYYWIKNNKK